MREEAKLEAKLKQLLKEAPNKRCVNCDSLGPQYVVSSFNVFVCTVCSGVHRQFGHRVKGVSMSTFKADEVAGLAESGNAKFAAFFLNKWQTSALPKPVDRDTQRIHSWIAAVYQERRFYAEPAGGWNPAATSSGAVPATSTTSESKEVSVRPLSEVLGSDTPKLSVQSTPGLERTMSATSKASSTGGATPTKPAVTASSSGAAVPAAARGLNLMDVPSPTASQAAAATPAAAAGGAAAAAWDPFGEQPAAPVAPAAPAPAPAAAAVQPSAPASAPAAADAWAAFGDLPAASSQAQVQPAAAAAPAPAPAGTEAADGGWEAFGDGPAAEPTPAPAAPQVPAAVAAAAAALPPSTAASSASSSPAKPAPPAAQQLAAAAQRQPVRSSSRPEVPMDVFYPEFEQIRATGMLPTGKPVPLPAFPPSYGATAGMHAPHAYPPGPAPLQQHSANPYAAYSYPAAAQQHLAAPYGGGYPGAAPAGPGARPTIAIPPTPQYPGGGYGGPSPATRPAASPAYSASSGFHSPSSLVSPAGSGISSAPSHSHAGVNGGYSYASLDSAGAVSTGSLSDLMPGSAAPTPAGGAGAGRRLGDPAADPFAGLAPGLRSALPAMPEASGPRYGAPPPTPAGMQPFPANGSAAMPPFGAPATAPYAPPPIPGAAGLPPATAAASATLFGRAPSLTGYDLSAPAAPKPQASGNPFA